MRRQDSYPAYSVLCLSPHSLQVYATRVSPGAAETPPLLLGSISIKLQDAFELPPNAPQEYVAKSPWADSNRTAIDLHAREVHEFNLAPFEVLTLDARGDNARALHLYQSLGFTEYGRLTDYAAFGERRYDMVMCKLDFRV